VGMSNDPVGMLMHYKECSVNIKKAKNMSEDELKGKIIVGELMEKENVPELTDEIKRLRMEAKRK
jgi:2-oxoglutarate ferredoxin oxidoreductase subunit beta